MGCGADRPVPASGVDRARPQIERIVALTPAASEILDGLGAFDRVVAVSAYAVHPPAVEFLPRLGTGGNSPLEALVALAPDLVVSGGLDSDVLSGHLRALGISQVLIPGRTIADIEDGIATLGNVLGVAPRAEAVVESMRRGLERVRNRTSGRGRPRVLLVVDRLPGTLRGVYVPSADSFLSELVVIAGGEPVRVTEGVGGYAQVNIEALVALDPDIVIETIQGEPGRFTEDSMAVWGVLPRMRAVASGRVYPVRDPSILHPSHRVVETAERFARLIHPGALDR
jgi:iron complex transport system substrate-binding protein